MEPLISLFAFSLFLVLFFLAIAWVYRNRNKINRWLNDPCSTHYEVVTREIYLKRRIEDAQRELEFIQKANQETETK
jgi:hypothetical protein